MKNVLSILFTTCFFLSLNAQDNPDNLVMGFEEYNPISTLVVPENPVTRAKYPFVDVHSHHWRGRDKAYFNNLKNEMDDLNMMALINLSGGTGERLQGNVDSSKAYMPGRFVVFANIELRSIDDPEWAENTVKQLKNDYKNGARGLKIYKSQGMSNVDSAGNRIKINDPRIDPIWEICGELGIPILIHSADPASFWDKRDANNERWLELKLRSRRYQYDADYSWQDIIDEQHDIFRKHPKTTFINAHMGWYANNLDKLSEIMELYPNMYTEIGAVIAELGRQPRRANEFFEKYQDRILFGKDAYNPDEYFTYFRVLETKDEYFPYYKKYHAFWRMYGLGLPDEILKKLYYKNALKVIPGLDASLFPAD